MNTSVLVVGAGPVGLTMACELARYRDQQLAGLVRHQRGLLVPALDGDETRVRPRHRLANRRRIRRVILVALDIGFHVNRRREFHLVAHRAKPPRPTMRRAASLHADRARLDLGEEFDDPGTAQFTFRGRTIFALQRGLERNSWRCRRQFGYISAWTASLLVALQRPPFGTRCPHSGGRGRDGDYSPPPAQIPAGAANAPGSHLGW
jgi:hypothetical protein